MNEISNDELQALWQVCSMATPGPWMHMTERGTGEGVGEPTDTGEWEVVTPEGNPDVILASEMDVADAEFVVTARTYLPLLVEDRRLRNV